VLETELMSYLRQLLPEYMVPSAIVVLDTLPQTPNHKVDLNALPPVPVRSDVDGAPRDELERELADLWGRLLTLDDVGIHNDVFQLNANSLHVMRLIAHLRKTYGVGIPAQYVFEHPTVAMLAERVRDALDADEESA
jgi:acyl carrier protein